MARSRTISPDFWTWEAVVDCAPMTRLLFLGLWSFADDFGVQPLKPRTIRMQVFPGDAIDAETVRAMIEELAARKLVWIYEVEGQEYFAIVDWAIHQRVSRCARRRYPPDPAIPAPAGAAEPALPDASPPPPPVAEPPETAPVGEPQRWRRMIKGLLGLHWPGHAQIESMDDVAADRWTAKWIADGCDYGHDVVPAVRDFYIDWPRCAPPADWQRLDAGVTGYRLRREAYERQRMAA